MISTICFVWRGFWLACRSRVEQWGWLGLPGVPLHWVPGSMSPLIGSSNLVLYELNLEWRGGCLVPRLCVCMCMCAYICVCVAVTPASCLSWLTDTVEELPRLWTGICITISTWNVHLLLAIQGDLHGQWSKLHQRSNWEIHFLW